MKTTRSIQSLAARLAVSFGLALTATTTFAHCDTLDGPVVAAARQALAAGQVTPALIWVQKADEAEVKAAFERTLAVRKLNADARELADRYFFETLVRLHRAGEGAPYTGLKPAGQDLGPAIPAADKALAEGNPQPLFKLLGDTMHEGLHHRFEQVTAKKNFARDDIAAGREFVKAYVEYVHYVEGVHQAARGAGAEHAHAESAAPAHAHE